MTAYVDTSALLKLLVREVETDDLRAIWDQVSDRYASLIGYVELRSAIAAARRARRLTGATCIAAAGEADVLWARLAAVEVDEPLVRDAGELADRHGLRAGDALHLASAMRIADGPTAFIAYDARLRKAAVAEGFIVLPDRLPTAA